MRNPGSTNNTTRENKKFGRRQIALLTLLTTLSAAAVSMGCLGLTSGAPPANGTGSGKTGGTPAAMLTSSPGTISFGSLPIGSQVLQSATITNTGKTAVTVSRISVSGTGFGLQSPSASSFSIPAGKSAVVQVQFAPQTANAVTGALSIVSDASNSPLSLGLSGTGSPGTVGQLSATPSNASFQTVPMGTNNTQTITLSNGGNAEVTVSKAVVSGTGFSVQGLSLPLVIAPGKAASFNASFTPSASSNVVGAISLLSNAPNSPLTISLEGSGLAATHSLGASTKSLSFGKITLGNMESLTVTLTNTGNSEITISKVAASGGGFAVNGVSPGTMVAPGQAAVLNVTFDPHTPGTTSGAITVSSNATSSPTISVFGTGVQPSSHSVALSWDPSTSDIVGYSVYRGIVSGGPYTRLNASPAVPTAFTDSNVQSGQTYVYVVAAIDSNNVESPYSNEVVAAVPTP